MDNDPLDSPSDCINVLLAALLGVAAVPGCPLAFTEQASRVILDNEWGAVAKDTHVLLSKLSDKEGKHGSHFEAVVHYYEECAE